MKYEFIRLESERSVAKVILNRPEYRNAQSRKLLEELDHAFTTAVEDDSVKVILLMAEGDHFCAVRRTLSPITSTAGSRIFFNRLGLKEDALPAFFENTVTSRPSPLSASSP